MEIAVYGGTFNPIHLGHLSFCCQCLDLYKFEQMLLIPTNLPPHKQAGQLASNEDRLAMLRLAAGERMVPCDLEYRLGGRSYTVETLRALSGEYPGGRFTLLMGSDMLRTFRQWYLWEEILSRACLLAGARHEEEYRELLTLRETFGEHADRIRIAPIQVTDISSTQIRETIQQGGDAGRWLPGPVWDYIREHRLYGCGER